MVIIRRFLFIRPLPSIYEYKTPTVTISDADGIWEVLFQVIQLPELSCYSMRCNVYHRRLAA